MNKVITTVLALAAFAAWGGRAEARDHCGGSYHGHCGGFRSYGCSSYGVSFGFPIFYSRPYYTSYYPYSTYYGGGYPYNPRFAHGYYDPAADVQVALARRGYYHGAIDGIIGPMTRSAIRQFQYDNGRPHSGVIDYPLLKLLQIY
jgi:hypothetical protein